MDKEERKQLSDSLQMDSDLHITTSPPPPPTKKPKKKKISFSFFFSSLFIFTEKLPWQSNGLH